MYQNDGIGILSERSIVKKDSVRTSNVIYDSQLKSKLYQIHKLLHTFGRPMTFECAIPIPNLV